MGIVAASSRVPVADSGEHRLRAVVLSLDDRLCRKVRAILRRRGWETLAAGSLNDVRPALYSEAELLVVADCRDERSLSKWSLESLAGRGHRILAVGSVFRTELVRRALAAGATAYLGAWSRRAEWDMRLELLERCPPAGADLEGSTAVLSLVARVPVPVHVVDSEGFLVAVSDRWLELLGLRRQDVLGRHWHDMLDLGRD